MDNIAVRPEYELPAAFEDVASFAIIAQQIAGVKTRAEMRLGELTAAMSNARGIRTDLTSPTRAEKFEMKNEALSRANISTQKASQYELMAAHMERKRSA